MGHQLKEPVRVSELAAAIGLVWRGSDHEILSVRSLDKIEAGSLCFSKNINVEKLDIEAVLIAQPDVDPGSGALILANNPRLAFARALIALDKIAGFVVHEQPPQVASDAVISATALLGCGVSIGARTVIGHHVVIADGVQIGEDCVVKSNTVIGESGFGFERDVDGTPVRILHLGNVVIGNRVEIGSLNTVCRATLGNTIIDDDVKTDDHVHIAHNCRVRRGALITACVELSGGVDIGEFSWIGPNSSILQKISIGNNAVVGIASNVRKSVADSMTVAGNPARSLPKQRAI